MKGPAALATITAAIVVPGPECLKGIADEAGKAAWCGVKAQLGWAADPTPAEVPEKVAAAVISAPELAEKLVLRLRTSIRGTVASMVGKIEASGGKVLIVQTMVATTFQKIQHA